MTREAKRELIEELRSRYIREGRKRRLAYARSGNPTTHVLEEKIAFLEQAEDALALACGMSETSSKLR